MRTYTVTDNLDHWLRGNNRGISSNTIVQHLTGFPALGDVLGPGYPEDPADLWRCLRLLLLVPELKGRMAEMGTVRPTQVGRVWGALAEHWEELERLSHEEYPTGKGPRTFARMREIIEEARAVPGENMEP